MREKGGTRDTTRISTTVVTYDDDDRRRDILRARPARTGAPDRLLLPRRCARLLRCTFPGGESRGHVDGSGSVRMPARRRRCDGRWECLVKPANCYRFIGTHGIHVPERKKDHREGSSVIADIITGPRETEWTISDYGNSRPVAPLSSRPLYYAPMCAH